jgi:hypothetical protein
MADRRARCHNPEGLHRKLASIRAGQKQDDKTFYEPASRSISAIVLLFSSAALKPIRRYENAITPVTNGFA